MNGPQSITIYVVDGTQASEMMRTSTPSLPVPNGNIQTPNISENINRSVENPNTKRFITPFMPVVNQITGGAAGRVNSAIEKVQRTSNAFTSGQMFLGGAIIVGEVANVVLKKVMDELSKQREKAAIENTANLLKIRTGQLQTGAGIYQTNIGAFGKVKYNTN